MADQIDLTGWTRADERDERESTFESAAWRSPHSSLTNGTRTTKNNKRTIDLTADSQEERPPAGAARADEPRIFDEGAGRAGTETLHLAMRAAITQAGLATADLLERARHRGALRAGARPPRRARAARRRARSQGPGARRDGGAPGARRLAPALLRRREDRRPAGGALERRRRAAAARRADAALAGNARRQDAHAPEAPATKARVLLAYDSARGAARPGGGRRWPTGRLVVNMRTARPRSNR